MTDSNIPPKAPASAKPSRKMRWVLVASLGLNLLIVGAIAGAVLSGGPRRGLPPSQQSIAMPYVTAFERADKRAMRDEMRGMLPPRKEIIAQNGADYRAFLAELRKEPFDREAAQQVMERQMSRIGRSMEIGRALALDRMEQMSADERAAYADRLEERINSKRRKHRK